MAEKYIIEGTVSELTKQRVEPFRFTALHNEVNDNTKYDVMITDNKNICFCIAGTEG
ncbi:MAG: hypothetical protein IJ158_04040 [Treponema sp.]|nr:hypothetical protein [Treponema sp.]